MKRPVQYYSLLYINETESVLGNGVSGTYAEKIQKYVRCCNSLNKSLVLHNHGTLKIITNNSDFIQKIEPSLECVQIEFKSQVDSSIPFASAHCKLDVFSYFAKLPDDEYRVLLDSDVLCINVPQKVLETVAGEGIPVVYDITDQQFQGCGEERVCGDKTFLIQNVFAAEKKEDSADFVSAGFWAGGELIGGTAQFFKSLSDMCKKIFPVYLENCKKLFHNGDEMIVSCALEILIRQKKIFVFDGGLMGIVGRYYDSGTNHVQHIWSYFKKNMFVHLPMDKDFLSETALDFSSHEKMMQSLESHLYRNKTFIEATVRADCLLQKMTKWFYRIRAFIKRLFGFGNAPVKY